MGPQESKKRPKTLQFSVDSPMTEERLHALTAFVFVMKGPLSVERVFLGYFQVMALFRQKDFYAIQFV